MVAPVTKDMHVNGFMAWVLSRFAKGHTMASQALTASHDGPRAPQMHALECDEPTAVVLVGTSGYDAVRAANSLRQAGMSVLTCTTLDEVSSRDWIGFHWPTHRVSHLVVDVDALGGIAKIYADLRHVRNTMPDLAVVLISSEFSVDDFSLERLALCDASIRANFTFASLEFAMSESAQVNNKVWQKRLHELETLSTHRNDAKSNVIVLRPKVA